MNRKKIIVVICSLLLVVLSGCTQRNAQQTFSSNFEENEVSHILVAYFSWSGNTKNMAEKIAGSTGGDLFEIIPEISYPDSYEETGNIAKEERDTNARPNLKDYPDIQKYDIILIGYPIWWHTAPMVIGSFLEHYD